MSIRSKLKYACAVTIFIGGAVCVGVSVIAGLGTPLLICGVSLIMAGAIGLMFVCIDSRRTLPLRSNAKKHREREMAE